MADDDGNDGDSPICHLCFSPTKRRCSTCGVCHFCSEKCEMEADARSLAHIACSYHLERTAREANNIGATGAHVVMLETTPLSAVPSCHKGTQWQTLVYGAMQQLQFLIARSSQTVCKKTAFGMSLVVTHDNKFCAGHQRRNYLDGKQSDAAAMMVRNMSELALEQLKATHAPRAPPKVNLKKKKVQNKHNDHKHHDYSDDTSNQACLVSGLVTTEGVHFDGIFLIRKDGAWTIHGVQPLWFQALTFLSHNRYRMSYKMEGHPPAKPRHSIALLEGALSQAPAPAPAPASAPAPAPPTEPPPPLELPPALAQHPPPPPHGEEEGEGEEEALSLEGMQLPPHLAQALEQALTSEEVPQWTQQLQEALQGAPSTTRRRGGLV